MLANPVARVYAEALFSIAQERSEIEEIGQELHEFVALVRENEDVAEFLASPVFDPSVKIRHLKEALAGRASDTIADFICLLVEKRRAFVLPMIASAYQSMADAHAARLRVSVQTPTPLADPLRDEIESILRDALKKKILIEEELEPALMGGAVIVIGDKVYDGSIRNRLHQFRKQITRSRSYEAQG